MAWLESGGSILQIAETREAVAFQDSVESLWHSWKVLAQLT